MVARPGPARYAFTGGIWYEWLGICPKKGLDGAYFDGITWQRAGDAAGVPDGFRIGFLMRFLEQDAAAWFSAILARPARDGEERS
jgi:hypothetical protein